MLTLERIYVTRNRGNSLERSVLHDLNLTIHDGEFVVVVGSNGAGKSTLFEVIAGAIRPDSGKIMLDNNDITGVSLRARAAYIAKVVQDPKRGTLENMSIFENMTFALQRGQQRGLLPLFKQSRKRLFQQKLAMLQMGLEKRLDDLVIHLSGGQRQALSISMAMLAHSKILLLDEITAALDPLTSETIIQLAANVIREEKQSCIMITHDMAHAIKYGNRLLLLQDGAFIQEYDERAKAKLNPLALTASFTNANNEARISA